MLFTRSIGCGLAQAVNVSKLSHRAPVINDLAAPRFAGVGPAPAVVALMESRLPTRVHRVPNDARPLSEVQLHAGLNAIYLLNNSVTLLRASVVCDSVLDNACTDEVLAQVPLAVTFQKNLP